MKVSVVIPVKDDIRILRCVAAVAAAAGDAEELEIVVVDNGSPPEFGATLDRLPRHVIVLRLPGGGPYAARNEGIAVATGEVIFFTDADAVPRQGWVAAGLRALADGGDVVCGYSAVIGGSRAAWIIQDPYERYCALLRRGDATVVNTRNVAVRANVFQTVRFDGSVARGSDAPFGKSARLAGFRLFFEPAMVVDHEHDPDLALHAAEQVCWGWNAQRIWAERTRMRHARGGLMRLGQRTAEATHIPVLKLGAAVFWGSARLSAGAVQRLAPVLPRRVASFLMNRVSLPLADRAGWLLYMGGRRTPPTPSQLLRRHVYRD